MTSATGLKYRTVRASPERGVAKTVLGVSDLCGDRLHLPVIGEAVADPDTRGVAAVGNRREACQAHEVAAVPGVDVRSGAPSLRP